MSCQGIGIWFGTANCPQDGKMKVQELLVGTCLVTHPMMAARVGRLSALLMIQHFVQSWRAFVMCIHGWHVMCTGTSCSVWILLVSCLHAMLIKARKCCASRLHLDYWQLPLFSERCQIWPRFHKSLRTVTSLSCQVDSPCFCIQSHPGVFLKKLCSPARCESINSRYSSQ